MRASAFPWQRPRHEAWLIALVALSALPVVQRVEDEDRTRMCITTALSHGRIYNDSGCFAGATHLVVHGHQYANTSPGVSALAVPMANLIGLAQPARWSPAGDLSLWAVRVSAVGLGLLVCAFLVGRIAEGLSPGWGGATLVTFALGTIASALAPSIFDHVPTAALAFGAFALAWSRRPFWAGIAAGLSIVVEYQAGVIVAALGLYALLAGLGSLGRYLLGVIPGAVLIGAYDWSAFGSPLSISYGSNPSQAGAHLPTRHGAHLVLVGDRGLLVNSPVLIAAAAGLVLLRRRAPVEAALCAVVTVAFVMLDMGYYAPYGGDSPGPRFAATALPFAVVGLGAAFARAPLPTALLAGASMIASTAVALTWPAGVNSAHGYGNTVWYYLGLFVEHGSGAAIVSWIQPTVFGHLGAGQLAAGGIVFGLAAIAFGLALRDGWSARSAPA